MERVDVIPREGGVHELPVMGVIELDGGKISAWRGDFDMGQMRGSWRRRAPVSLPSMPTDLGLKAMNAVHRGLLKVSGGRVGWDLSRMPVLELTTTGRKSGQPRSVM